MLRRRLTGIGVPRTVGGISLDRKAGGERVRSTAEMNVPMMEAVTVDEAARRAGFPVWVPATVEPGWELQVHHTRAHDDPPLKDQARRSPPVATSDLNGLI
ncbi:MAG: hypothetical protein WKF65_02245 [Gaiellaceae bacterium]